MTRPTWGRARSRAARTPAWAGVALVGLAATAACGDTSVCQSATCAAPAPAEDAGATADGGSATDAGAGSDAADSGRGAPALENPALAFPGAEGAGAVTPGGRGGRTYVVTTLADAGAGSLRECVEARGARTCVFAVAGTIRLDSSLYIVNPLLTVAGQSAPAGGIALGPAAGRVISSLVLVSTHDVVWRYTRLRHEYRAACADSAASECGALFDVESRGTQVIADHNSLSWNQDEAYGVWRGGADPVHDLTFSNSLIAEGYASHSTGLIAGGESALASEVTNVDMHHNVVMNNSHRNPLLKIGSGQVVANVFYNQRFYDTQCGGGGTYDIVGNVYRRGPLTGAAFAEVQGFAVTDWTAPNGHPSLFLQGNVGWHQPDPSKDQWALAREVTGENGKEVGPMPDAWRRAARRSDAAPIRVEPDLAAKDGPLVPHVGASRRLDCGGAWVMNRDSVDTRLVKEFVDGAGIGALPAAAGDRTIPALESGPACADADRDGMPDAWETGHGLDPNDPSDGPAARPSAHGYTNLELFLSGLFPGSTPLP